MALSESDLCWIWWIIHFGALGLDHHLLLESKHLRLDREEGRFLKDKVLLSAMQTFPGIKKIYTIPPKFKVLRPTNILRLIAALIFTQNSPTGGRKGQKLRVRAWAWSPQGLEHDYPRGWEAGWVSRKWMSKADTDGGAASNVRTPQREKQKVGEDRAWQGGRQTPVAPPGHLPFILSFSLYLHLKVECTFFIMTLSGKTEFLPVTLFTAAGGSVFCCGSKR